MSGPTGSWTGKVQLTHKQLEDLWIGNGGSIGYADTAAAIAQAESSGCQYALAGPKDIRPHKDCSWHKTSGENSCGYWQINLYAHPQYKAPGIFGQNENASAAIAISNDGQDFRPWTTYKNGAYKQYLTDAGGTSGGGSGGGSKNPAESFPVAWARFVRILAHRGPTSHRRVVAATARVNRIGRKR